MAPRYVLTAQFSPEAAQVLLSEQGQDSPNRLQVLVNKNVRKPGGKNADKRPDKGQVSVIAQENLKLAAFLFHQRWRCTFDWEEMGVWEDTVYLLASQKRLNKITRTQMCCLKSIGLTWQVQWRPSESTLGHVMVS